MLNLSSRAKVLVSTMIWFFFGLLTISAATTSRAAILGNDVIKTSALSATSIVDCVMTMPTSPKGFIRSAFMSKPATKKLLSRRMRAMLPPIGPRPIIPTVMSISLAPKYFREKSLTHFKV
jgi:hypothetical protein